MKKFEFKDRDNLTVGERFDRGWVNPLSIAKRGMTRYREPRVIHGALAAEECHARACPYIGDDGVCPKWGPWDKKLEKDSPVPIRHLWRLKGDCCFLRWWKEDRDE